MWGNGERAAVQTSLRPFISENLAASSCKYLFNDDMIIGIKKLGASQFPADPLLPARCCSRSQQVIYSRSVKATGALFLFPCILTCCNMDKWKRHFIYWGSVTGGSNIQGRGCCQMDVVGEDTYVTFISREQTLRCKARPSSVCFMILICFSVWLSLRADCWDFCGSFLH